MDIDFLLRQKPSTLKDVEKMIKEIIETPTGNDFIKFETKMFENISPHRKYQGISTQLIGKINRVQVPFDIDIGVGDVIVPKAEKRKIISQLEDFETLEISTYSL